MSSAAIMAKIKQKEAELQKLQVTKTQVSKVSDAVDCMSYKFQNASSLINEAGTIGGSPIDNGATTVVAGNFKKLSSNTQGVLAEISGSITALEAEIASLYDAYYAALAREREEAARAAAEEKNKTR